MVALELNFYPRDDTRGRDFDQFDEQLENFVCALRGNGNIFDGWITLELDECVQVRAQAPETEAILKENWSIYAHKYLEQLLPMCFRGPVLQVVYEDGETRFCCQCEERSSYILFTTYLDRGLPVDCGDCRLPIPLYRLPHINDEEEHWTIRNWQSTYAALDTLFMECYIGERFSYCQMHSAHSELTKWSRKIAAQFEEKTGKPFFVFLMHHYHEFRESCPRCRRVWRLDKPWHDFFAFKCDHCRLISSEASSEATPLSELHP